MSARATLRSAPRTILGYADDVAAVADRLGLDVFGVIGASGGGHYALACAARLGTRLTRVVVVNGIGPLRTPGSLSGMASANKLVFRIARVSPRLVGIFLSQSIGRSLPAMEAQVRAGTSPSPLMTPDAFAVVVADQREAIRQGGAGVIFDARNLWHPWGFELPAITTRVDLWDGAADDLAPVELARRVAACIPNCRSTFFEGEGHVEPLLNHGDEILAAALAVTERRSEIAGPPVLR